MYNIGICDDDKNFSDKLFKAIEHYCSIENIRANICVYETGRELLFKLYDNNYIGIFLDIEMPDIFGLELAAEIKKYHPDTILIFVISYIKYATRSFELSVFRYIPKAYLQERIDKALEDAFNIIKLQKGENQLVASLLI